MEKFKIRFIADNDDKRSKGLMFADPLEEDEAVFFIFPFSDNHSFWNKNVSFDLRLAFLDELGRVVDFGDLIAQSIKPVASSRPARFVVEAAKGAFDRKNVKLGDIIKYQDHSLVIVSLK